MIPSPALSAGVVESWKDACLLAKVHATALTRIRRGCAETSRLLTLLWGFTFLFSLLTLGAVAQYFTVGLLIPTFVPATALMLLVTAMFCFGNVGSINLASAKINEALHTEHLRLVYQRGALSLSTSSSSGDGGTGLVGAGTSSLALASGSWGAGAAATGGDIAWRNSSV